MPEDRPNPPAPFPTKEGGALPSPDRGGAGGGVLQVVAGGGARVEMTPFQTTAGYAVEGKD